MIETITELEESLKSQLASLASDIQNAESSLLRTKEGYLKVQGAIEILDVLKNKISASVTAEPTDE